MIMFSILFLRKHPCCSADRFLAVGRSEMSRIESRPRKKIPFGKLVHVDYLDSIGSVGLSRGLSFPTTPKQGRTEMSAVAAQRRAPTVEFPKQNKGAPETFYVIDRELGRCVYVSKFQISSPGRLQTVVSPRSRSPQCRFCHF
jgi:hypothetical protein